jgi:hypothetical protein
MSWVLPPKKAALVVAFIVVAALAGATRIAEKDAKCSSVVSFMMGFGV